MAQIDEEGFKKLKDVINSIQGDTFPSNYANYIWSMYNFLNDTHENEPCLCGSAASHWRRYIDFHRNFIKGK
jgi:hypothetical protein